MSAHGSFGKVAAKQWLIDKLSVKNHSIGFAAEKARHNDSVVNEDEFDKEYGFPNE